MSDSTDKRKEPVAGRQGDPSSRLSPRHAPFIDAEVERRVVRKTDKALLPLVMALFLMAFLDRSNIGNAELAGMSEDLGFGDDKFEWLLTIFYIPYIICEPLALMWKLIPANIWAFVCVFVWGVSSTLQAGAFNWEGLMVCRWFLAMAEAGYAPGVPYLLSFFYKRRELGLRCGLYLSSAPLASTFAGALAYGITGGHSAMSNWRLLFLVEGLPSIVLAFVALFTLPKSAETATFLTKEEKEVARARAIVQAGGDGASRTGRIDFRDVFESLKDIKTWIPPLMYFSCNVSYSSLPVYLPAIVKGMGFSSINAQGLTAPPYLLAFLVCIASTYFADRTGQRGLTIAVLSLVGAIGFILLATIKTVGVRYFASFLAAAGVFPAIANILPWTLNNQGSDSKRGAGISLLNLIGQVGPILGTRSFPKRDAPRYVHGMSVCAAFMSFNILLALFLRFHLARENDRFERADAEARAAAGHDAAALQNHSAVENEGYGFRNIL